MDATDVLGAPARKAPPLLEAIVHRIDSDGLHVRLTAGQQRYVHGPCRWSRPPATTATATSGDHSPHAHDVAGDPPPGTRCLVARSDTGRWWVVAFDGWPA